MKISNRDRVISLLSDKVPTDVKTAAIAGNLTLKSASDALHQIVTTGMAYRERFLDGRTGFTLTPKGARRRDYLLECIEAGISPGKKPKDKEANRAPRAVETLPRHLAEEVAATPLPTPTNALAAPHDPLAELIADALIPHVANVIRQLFQSSQIRQVVKEELEKIKPRFDAVGAEVATSIPQPPPDFVVSPTPAKVVLKPKLLVVGLLGMQIAEVQREFSDAFIMRFAKKEHTDKMVFAKGHDVDRILVMVDFLSHPTIYGLKARFPGKVVHVNGNVSGLKRVLESLKEQA